MKLNTKIRVIEPHTPLIVHRHYLFYPGGWRDHPAVVYRDAVGRMGNGGTYAWLPMICAISEDCPAQVLVRRDFIEDFANEALKSGIIP